MFLADIGTSSYTAYETGKDAWMSDDVMKMYELFPGLMKGTHKNQHIHTHHTMGAFFSGTDWEQMLDRSENSNYLLMLIVNESGRFCAKVGFRAKKQGSGEMKLTLSNNTDGYSDKILTSDTERDCIVTMDCEIQYTTAPSVDDEFVKRWQYVRGVKRPATRFVNNSTQGLNRSGTQTQARLEFDKDPSTYSAQRDDTWDYEKHEWKGKKTKKDVMAMTDEEWTNYLKEEDDKLDVPENRTEFPKADIHVFVNAIIDRVITRNTKYPFDRLIKLDTDTIKRERFLETLEKDSYEYWNDLFPKSFIGDYFPFMEAVREKMEPFKAYKVYESAISIITEEVGDLV